MNALLRQALLCGGLVTAAALTWTVAARSRPTDVEAGFWFDRVTFQSVRLGGAITPADLAAIEGVARGELGRAFAGLPIRISNRRDALYRVRVAQEVRDLRLRANSGVAGASVVLPGLGGHSEVSFGFMAGGATARAPEQATRDEILAAIGRGIGRTAVHELTHQLLPQAPIHDSRDVRSYEFYTAARAEQYFGDMHWDLARPLLVARFSR